MSGEAASVDAQRPPSRGAAWEGTAESVGGAGARRDGPAAANDARRMAGAGGTSVRTGGPGNTRGAGMVGQRVSEFPVPLSVLDLAPVGEGSAPDRALRHSLALVAEAERLGYRRYWVAEHHNMPGIASSAPAVLLAHAAGVTSSIRLG